KRHISKSVKIRKKPVRPSAEPTKPVASERKITRSCSPKLKERVDELPLRGYTHRPEGHGTFHNLPLPRSSRLQITATPVANHPPTAGGSCPLRPSCSPISVRR